jgi:hypothetical protein
MGAYYRASLIRERNMDMDSGVSHPSIFVGLNDIFSYFLYSHLSRTFIRRRTIRSSGLWEDTVIIWEVGT